MKSNLLVKFKKDDKGTIAAVIGVIIGLLAAIIIGVLVYWQVGAAVGDPLSTSTTYGGQAGTDYNASHASYNSSMSKVNTTAGNVFNLMVVVPIVVVASIIIGVVVGFGTGKVEI